jgi:non-specific serine/threonine protein kinase/serine/threonine-protein kinase
VALKLVKAGMNSREVIGQFESERPALALMNHPATSNVLDAGSTSQGAPYFVMEYVAGVPISEYCDNYRLTTRERLDLFIQVCEGVQHAHHKAIIHRDLKPSNILVEEVDGRSAPKIIDLGVAKPLSRNLSDGGMLTRVGTLIGTPEYMSPEQATSSGRISIPGATCTRLESFFCELLVGSPPLGFTVFWANSAYTLARAGHRRKRGGVLGTESTALGRAEKIRGSATAAPGVLGDGRPQGTDGYRRQT